MKKHYNQVLTLTIFLIIGIIGDIYAQSFTIAQNVTGNNRKNIRGQAFTPSVQGNGSGTITSDGWVYLTSFDVVYAGGSQAPTLYIYSSLPSDLSPLDDGTGGNLIAESTGKTEKSIYTSYSFDYVKLDKNTKYYAVFRQDVRLEFGGSLSEGGPYAGGKMLVNDGKVTENGYTGLRFKGTFDNSRVYQGDVDALVALYNATDGANWTTKWDLQGDPYEWYGITWKGRRVEKIELYGNSLTGQIPAELGNLAKLNTLNLLWNKLEGGIPKELGQLSELVELNLSDNSLTGNIPPALGNLNQLASLELAWNKIDGQIPAELGQLSNLERLDLASNFLSGTIPPELGNLDKLIYLYLYRDSLQGNIPMELSNMENLKYLELFDNSLSGTIPPELAKLSNLVDLDLSVNKLTGTIPMEIFDMKSLEILWIDDNSLSGPIPPELGKMKSLRTLGLGHNQFTGTIPTELGSLDSLERLFLYDNHLEGEIPKELGSLKRLQRAGFYGNSFTNIAFDLSSLENMKWLSLENNQFDFGDFEHLTTYLDSIERLYISPQAKLPVQDSLIVSETGKEVNLTVSTPGKNNYYVWFKDGKAISDSTANPDFVIADFKLSDVGRYYCKVTNPDVPWLTLYSRTIKVTTPMEFTVTPHIVETKSASATVQVSTNKQGNVYYMALPYGGAAPTMQQVIDGTDAEGNLVGPCGTTILNADSLSSLTITGLNLVEKQYNLYIVAKDSLGALSNLAEMHAVLPIQFNDNYPSITESNTESIKLHVSANKSGKSYYVILPFNSASPTAQQIIEGKGAMGNMAPHHGNLEMASNNVANLTVAGLAPATKYEIYMVAEDQHGTVTKIVKLEGTTSSITGVSGEWAPGQIHIFPMPVQGQVQIEMHKNVGSTMSILDLNGKVYGKYRLEAQRTIGLDENHKRVN